MYIKQLNAIDRYKGYIVGACDDSLACLFIPWWGLLDVMVFVILGHTCHYFPINKAVSGR
jgi:hypothetical protein